MKASRATRSHQSANELAACWAARLAIATAACLAGAGCIGVPNPLAPGLQGSVGLPHFGALTGAAPMPQRGEGFRRLRTDDMRWGTPRLVRTLTKAAAQVQRDAPGGVLVVADLSARSGGKVPHHRSHRTGRDVDVLFYALTPSGVPVASPGFIHFGPDGLAEHEGRFYRLDVERNWRFVRALVTDPGAAVQWMFASRAVEALLVEYARARGEPDELVWKAQAVLHEPGDSAAHDDHFHVRLACSPDEAVAGCAGGPRWQWLPPLPILQEGDVSVELAAVPPEGPPSLAPPSSFFASWGLTPLVRFPP